MPHDVQGYINEAGEELLRVRLDSMFVTKMADDIPGAQ